MNDFVVKVGNIELMNSELNDFYFSGKRYLVAYRKVYALEWCENYVNPDGNYGGVYGHEIYYHDGKLPLTKRGRWAAKTAEEVNRLIGRDLLIVR